MEIRITDNTLKIYEGRVIIDEFDISSLRAGIEIAKAYLDPAYQPEISPMEENSIISLIDEETNKNLLGF